MNKYIALTVACGLAAVGGVAQARPVEVSKSDVAPAAKLGHEPMYAVTTDTFPLTNVTDGTLYVTGGIYYCIDKTIQLHLPVEDSVAVFPIETAEGRLAGEVRRVISGDGANEPMVMAVLFDQPVPIAAHAEKDFKVTYAIEEKEYPRCDLQFEATVGMAQKQAPKAAPKHEAKPHKAKAK